MSSSAYERPPPAPPDVPWNLPTNKKPVWLRDERDDHQEARLAVRPEHGEPTRRHGALRPVRSLPAGVRQRQTPRRTSGDAAASPSRPSPPPRATVTVPLLQPATQAFAFSERAAGLRAAEGASRPAARLRRPAAAALAAEAALAAAHLRRAHADLRRWQWRRLVPPGGDAARPRTRRAMGPRHTRGRSGERAEREREPEGFTGS